MSNKVYNSILLRSLLLLIVGMSVVVRSAETTPLSPPTHYLAQDITIDFSCQQDADCPNNLLCNPNGNYCAQPCSTDGRCRDVSTTCVENTYCEYLLCTRPYTNTPSFIPLNELGTNRYFAERDGERAIGLIGGLYLDNGSPTNSPPSAHLAQVMAKADTITPLNDAGDIDAINGKIGVVSVGISNTRQHWETLMNHVYKEPALNPAIVFANGAQGGVDVKNMAGLADASRARNYWMQHLPARLQEVNLHPNQVQVIWLMTAVHKNNFETTAFADQLQEYEIYLATLIDLLQNKDERINGFPNLRLIYLSSREYGGWTNPDSNSGGPEPFAYETGFGVRQIIQHQIEGTSVETGQKTITFDYADTPALFWGPYIWADGTTPNTLTGLFYEPTDFYRADCMHPTLARQKVSEHLLTFFFNDETAVGWMLADDYIPSEPTVMPFPTDSLATIAPPTIEQPADGLEDLTSEPEPIDGNATAPAPVNANEEDRSSLLWLIVLAIVGLGIIALGNIFIFSRYRNNSN